MQRQKTREILRLNQETQWWNPSFTNDELVIQGKLAATKHLINDEEYISSNWILTSIYFGNFFRPKANSKINGEKEMVDTEDEGQGFCRFSGKIILAKRIWQKWGYRSMTKKTKQNKSERSRYPTYHIKWSQQSYSQNWNKHTDTVTSPLTCWSGSRRKAAVALKNVIIAIQSLRYFPK